MRWAPHSSTFNHTFPGGEDAFTTPSWCVSSVNYINYDLLFFRLNYVCRSKRKLNVGLGNEELKTDDINDFNPKSLEFLVRDIWMMFLPMRDWYLAEHKWLNLKVSDRREEQKGSIGYILSVEISSLNIGLNSVTCEQSFRETCTRIFGMNSPAIHPRIPSYGDKAIRVGVCYANPSAVVFTYNPK